MGETTGQIASHIDDERRALRSNLQELEGRVRSATDWRQYVRNNPAATLAVAFGAGLLAANMVGHGRSRRRTAAQLPPPETGNVAGPRKGEALRPWRNIQSALVGATAAKVQEALADIVPGFKEHLGRVENRSRGSGPDAPPREAVQGEGDYRAAREYRRDVERFVASADIERAAREAAPRDEAEAAELEAAEQQGRRGNPRSERTGPGPPHR
jgi:hypothetical protein